MTRSLSLPVLYRTATQRRAATEDAERADAEGFAAPLIKHIDLNVLIETIRNVLISHDHQAQSVRVAPINSFANVPGAQPVNLLDSPEPKI